jgi:pimeloyl-ACP methyl ester carboxylesterase
MEAVRITGDVEEGYGKVADAFRRNFTQYGEVGAACAVYKDGRKVVDLWGGYRDGRIRAPWQQDTLSFWASATKGMAATAGLIRMLLRPTPAGIKGLWRYLSASDEWIEDLFVDQAYLGWKHIKLARGVFPSGFRDHELRQLSMPTLLLEGEQTPAYSAQPAIDHARELIPQIQAEIIAGAGEMLPIEQPDAVNRRLTEDIRA